MAEEITRDEIKNALAKGSVILVEALPEKYYEEGHLPGAIRINHDEAGEKIGALLPDKDAFIVTYCASASCSNSAYLADLLVNKGYQHVKKYVGGKKDWIDAGENLEVT